MDTTPEVRLSGIAASPGIAMGVAHCLYDIPTPHALNWDSSTDDDLLSELAALEEAVSLATYELRDVREKVAGQLGQSEAKIFDVHLSILHDQSLLEKVRRLVRDRRLTALAALIAVASEYDRLFASVKDEFIRERAADLKDVLQRLGKHLSKTEPRISAPLQTPMILVANELLPSDVLAITEHDILGIVTQSGGRTSHAAILARSYGIPSVAGVPGILDAVASGNLLIVDGGSGKIVIHPNDATTKEFSKQRQQYDSLRHRLEHQPTGSTQTADQVQLELMANVSCVADAMEARREGASGIGLFRTEFYFLTHSGMPSEDEQFEEYLAVIQAAPEAPVTIRTLDLGGDKMIPYLTRSHELNPIMGMRSIRISFAHPDFFQQQIRAVLRVAHQTHHAVRLMFPMITNWEELQWIRQHMDDARGELELRGQAYGDVAIGAMIEVPAAAVMIEHLLEAVDFISIGTNDLVQYLNAADRDNSNVNHLCQALSPAVIRVLQSVIDACGEANKDVSVCGEMAGSPRAFPLLLGMGLRNFSMSPAFIPMIRDLAAHVTITDGQHLLDKTLKLRTPGDIQKLLDDYIAKVCPDAVAWLLN